MKKLVLIALLAFSGCAALPYAFNAAGFAVTQYLSQKRQDEIMAKMEGYDVQLGEIEKMLGDTTAQSNGLGGGNAGDLGSLLALLAGSGFLGAGGLYGGQKLADKLKNKEG